MLMQIYEKKIKPEMDNNENRNLMDVKAVIDARASERMAMRFIEKKGLTDEFQKSLQGKKHHKEYSH